MNKVKITHTEKLKLKDGMNENHQWLQHLDDKEVLPQDIQTGHWRRFCVSNDRLSSLLFNHVLYSTLGSPICHCIININVSVCLQHEHNYKETQSNLADVVICYFASLTMFEVNSLI